MPLNEWGELENRIFARSAGAPKPGLRGRIMQSVTDELLLPKQKNRVGQSSHGHQMAIGAAALIVINISMISASKTTFVSGSMPSHDRAAKEIQALQQVEAQQQRIFK